jgi:hypothetical protein
MKKKLVLSFLCVIVFVGCKDDEPRGNHRIRMLEQTSLQLRSDGASFEVKGYALHLSNIEMDDKVYFDSIMSPYRSLPSKAFRDTILVEWDGWLGSDTIAVEWLELWKTKKGVRLKPQPNTTGAERKAIINFWNPDPGYYDLTLMVTQPSK